MKIVKSIFIFIFCVGIFCCGVIFSESLLAEDILGYIVSIGHFILYTGLLICKALEEMKDD